MNFLRSNTNSNEVPIAESTQIEKTSRTPLKGLRSALTRRLGLLSTSNSVKKETQSSKRAINNSMNLSKLDPQVILDTQSNGFASRVVKYHEASEAKSREISNKAYRRPGDFPIVNLEKSEINLNQRQANEPKISKINIASPVNLVDASNASARSIIFRTGKNYGDSYLTGKLGPIEGRKPIKPTISPDEPILSPNNDYDTPTRSSLEALKEISRKRIHCDEIDGDTNKKQRDENSSNESEQNNPYAVNVSKRPRDKTSPSQCSSLVDALKKRYKNNDISSSLSSSILPDTPKPTKRSLLNVEVALSKKPPVDRELKKVINDLITAERLQESSRVGTSNSDLPLHRPSEQIKPVTKSMSDGYVPKQPQQTKTTKLTLFNKEYKIDQLANERGKNLDDDEENSISFVKPKAKATTIFSAHKNRDKKSKLAMMLGFLRGDESTDEVDSVKVVEKPTEQKDKLNETGTSLSANLTTSTSVTFSTATTTSLLNVPPTVAVKTIEPLKNTVNNLIDIPKLDTVETSNVVTTTPPSVVPTSKSEELPKPVENQIKLPSPKVTFNLPTTQSTSQATPLSDSTPPRLGGFSFTATPTAVTLPEVKTITTESIQKINDTQAKTGFSFGLTKPKPTSNAALPSFTPPTFASSITSKIEPTAITSTGTSNEKTAPTVTFNFGNPEPKTSVVPQVASPISFGTPNTKQVTSTTNSFTSSTPSLFSFGTAKTNASLTSPVTSTTTTSAPASNSFVFGSSTPNPVNTFGLNTTQPNTVSETKNTTPSQPMPLFSFGNTTNTTKPEANAFHFGKTATTVATPSQTFGSQSVSSAPLLTGNSAFGSANPAQSSSTFSFSANKPAAATEKPSIFGTPTTTTSSGFGSFSTSASAFGQANPTTTTSTNIFGSSAGATSTPIFGSSNISTPSAQPKSENAFSITGNPTNNTPIFGGSQNKTDTFGKANPPPYSANLGTNTGIFGASANPPAFNTSNNLFSTPTTVANQSQSSTNAFGSSASGIFAFGQSAQTPKTTTANNNAPASGFGGISTFGSNTSATPSFGGSSTSATPSFGGSSTSATPSFGGSSTSAAPSFGGSSTNAIPSFGGPSSSAFVFGQTNTTPTTGLFDSKPAENPSTNSSLTAPPSFGSSTSAFNFNAKPMFGNQTETKPSSFSFNAPNNAAVSVTSFGSAPATPQFGSNGMGGSFPFSGANNQADASKAFNFGGSVTAPVVPVASAPFSFNAPAQPAQNAFQFNATPSPQPVAGNIFSIGPGSGANTTKTGRPMRTATRRIK